MCEVLRAGKESFRVTDLYRSFPGSWTNSILLWTISCHKFHHMNNFVESVNCHSSDIKKHSSKTESGDSTTSFDVWVSPRGVSLSISLSLLHQLEFSKINSRVTDLLSSNQNFNCCLWRGKSIWITEGGTGRNRLKKQFRLLAGARSRSRTCYLGVFLYGRYGASQTQ